MNSKSTSKQDRRLVAILFADIVGYTAMMQSDEGKAMSRLRHYQNVLDDEIQKNNGQIIKNYGDGSLCVFSSVLDAVNCAKGIQERLSKEPKVPLRIGLHLGDIMYEGNDIYGDALNIASRIESMGVAGAVLLSNDIYKKVKNQADLRFQSLSSFEFKNVDEPMEIYALANNGMAVPKASEMHGKLKTKKQNWIVPTLIAVLLLAIVFAISNFFMQKDIVSDEVSLAIIPFRNISGDDSNSHYGLGMASEIRTKLSLSKKFENISSLQATAAYAKSDKTPSEIGKELNVNYLVMGLFQMADDDIRVNVELLDVATGKSVEEIPQYQNKFTDIFQLQSEIANRVLRQFSFFNSEEIDNASSYEPDILAYGHYLKGREILMTGWTEEIWKSAYDQFAAATQIDSSYLLPWIGQLHATTDLIWWNYHGDTLLSNRAASIIQYIEDNFPESWATNYARGVYEYHGLSNYEKGRQFFQKSLDVNPENSDAHSLISAIYKRQLKTPEALYHLAKAKDLSPNDVTIWREVQEVSMRQGDYQTAMEMSKTQFQLGDERVGRNRARWVANAMGDMSIIPAEWRSSYGTNYEYLENYYNKQWDNCHTILDTTTSWSEETRIRRKINLFHITNKKDSCQHYAQHLITFYEENDEELNHNRKATALAILGKGDEALDIINSGSNFNNNWKPLDNEDLLHTAVRMARIVDHYILDNNYEMANTTLLALNESFPGYGDYNRFRIDPFYDRIKEEYALFAQTVNNLRLPLIVPFDEPLKN